MALRWVLASHQCDLGLILAQCRMWVEFVVGFHLASRVFLQFFSLSSQEWCGFFSKYFIFYNRHYCDGLASTDKQWLHLCVPYPKKNLWLWNLSASSTLRSTTEYFRTQLKNWICSNVELNFPILIFQGSLFIFHVDLVWDVIFSCIGWRTCTS